MANLSNINGKFVVEQTTGYVGVGTTDPNYPIEVLNASAEIALNASGASIYRLRSDNTDSFRINKNGVGDRLVIAGNGNATFAGNVDINGGEVKISGNYAKLFFEDTGGTIDAYIVNNADGLFFGKTNSPTPANDILSLDLSTKNVGIGTISPAAKLEVKENLYVSHPNAEELTFRIDNYGSTGTDAGSLLRLLNQAGTTVVNIDSRSGSSRDTYFNQGGNFGIGTASPGYKLNVINDNTATWTARFTNNTNNVYLSVNDANNYGIYVSGETKNYFSGNVGIGTTNPNAKLHVNGSVHFGTDSAVINPTSGQLLLETTAGNSTSLLMYTYGASIFQIQSQGTTAQIGWGSSQPRTVNFTNSGAGSIAVGIGTTSPTSTLSVQGTTNNGINVIGVGTTATRVYAGLNSSNHGYLFATGSSGQSPSLINSAGGDSYISGGNVGIGITSPQDKLHVNGDAIISSTKFGDFAVASINTTGYAIATISATTNGQSAIVEFVASGNNGGYYNVVYSCYNGGGVWYYTKNVVGSGGNIEVAETNGAGSSTLVFYFRATSSSASYTPRVMMKGMPYNLVTF